MQEFLAELEGPVLLWIQEYVRNDFLTPMVTFLTHLGDAGILWIVLTLVLLVYAKTRKTGAVMALSMILNALVTNIVLKNILARTRPYEIIDGLYSIVGAQKDYSFPSGHSACSFACAVVIYRYCPKKYGISALAAAVLIALSRLYVGVHFPTDVLGGALVGTFAALLACRIDEKWNLGKRIGVQK